MRPFAAEDYEFCSDDQRYGDVDRKSKHIEFSKVLGRAGFACLKAECHDYVTNWNCLKMSHCTVVTFAIFICLCHQVFRMYEVSGFDIFES